MVAWYRTKAGRLQNPIARHKSGDEFFPPLVAYLRLWCGMALAGEPWPFRRSRRRWSRRLRWHRLRRRAVAVERSQDGRARRFGGRRGREGGGQLVGVPRSLLGEAPPRSPGHPVGRFSVLGTLG